MVPVKIIDPHTLYQQLNSIPPSTTHHSLILRAPELLFSTSPAYTPAIDLWSCGCILGEWIRGKPLLPARDEWGQIRLICELLGVPSDRVWPGFEELMRGDGMKLKLPDQPYCNTRNGKQEREREGE